VPHKVGWLAHLLTCLLFALRFKTYPAPLLHSGALIKRQQPLGHPITGTTTNTTVNTNNI
jgi:hypothetical protein